MHDDAFEVIKRAAVVEMLAYLLKYWLVTIGLLVGADCGTSCHQPVWGTFCPAWGEIVTMGVVFVSCIFSIFMCIMLKKRTSNFIYDTAKSNLNALIFWTDMKLRYDFIGAFYYIYTLAFLGMKYSIAHEAYKRKVEEVKEAGGYFNTADTSIVLKPPTIISLILWSVIVIIGFAFFSYFQFLLQRYLYRLCIKVVGKNARTSKFKQNIIRFEGPGSASQSIAGGMASQSSNSNTSSDGSSNNSDSSNITKSTNSTGGALEDEYMKSMDMEDVPHRKSKGGFLR